MVNYIGLNIKYLCEKNFLSQKEFGDLFGTGQATINTYIRGRSNPNVETMQKICTHFDISIDDFINTDLSGEKNYKGFATPKIAAEPETNYINEKDAIIAAQRETIETQKELIANLRSQLGRAS